MHVCMLFCMHMTQTVWASMHMCTHVTCVSVGIALHVPLCMWTCVHMSLCGIVCLCVHTHKRMPGWETQISFSQAQPLLPGALIEENRESSNPQSGTTASVRFLPPPPSFLTQIACGTKGAGTWIIYTVNIKQLVVYLNSSLLSREIPWQTLRQ